MLLPLPKVEFGPTMEQEIEAEISRRTFKPYRLFVPSHVAIDFEILSIKTKRKIRATRDEAENTNWIDEELLLGDGVVNAVIFSEVTTLQAFDVEPLRKGDKIVLTVRCVPPTAGSKRFFTGTWDGV